MAYNIIQINYMTDDCLQSGRKSMLIFCKSLGISSTRQFFGSSNRHCRIEGTEEGLHRLIARMNYKSLRKEDVGGDSIGERLWGME